MAINYTGLDPKNNPTWFKKRVIFSEAIAIPEGAGSGKVLTSDADGNMTLETPGGTVPATVLISTATASTSATIDFTGLNNTYRAYKVIITDMVVVSDSALYFRVGTGGVPTYQSGVSDYGWVYNVAYVFNAGSGYVNVSDYDDSEISINNSLDNAANSVFNAEITIYNPSQSTLYHNISWVGGVYYATGAETDSIIGTGNYKATTAVTAIRLLLSTGNIASGKFSLFGIL